MAVARFDTIRSLAFGSILITYVAVGTPLTQNWREFRIINDTDGDMFFSADGTNDNFFLPANSFLLWDLATNAPSIQVTDNFVIGLGTQFYVRYSTAPSVGSVYIEGIYARNS
jgi:hypothetical protein